MQLEPGINILLLDDQKENVLALGGILSSSEFNLVKTHSSEAALKCILNQEFAVILIHVQMPTFDGFETASLIRKQPKNQHTPIIFITDCRLTETVIFQGYSVGTVDYIIKPIRPELLLAKVAVFVDLFKKTLELKKQAAQLKALNEQLRNEITQRKLAEKALQQSEERYGAIVEAQTELITRFQRDGTLTFVNEAYCRYFGQSQLDIIGKSYKPFVFPEDLEKIAQILDSLSWENRVGTIEHRVIVNGQICWTQWVNQAIFDEQGQFVEFQSTGRDITERKMTEERLRLLERAIAASSNGIVITDALAPNNPVIYANSGFERITGYKSEEVIGKNCRFLQGIDKAQPALAQLRHAITSGTGTQVVLRNYRKDGRLFWNEFCVTPVRDEAGRLTHFIGIQTDITRRKRAEEALKESEERWQLALRGNNDGIWDWNVKTNEVFFSARWKEMLGYEDDEISNHLDERALRIHPDDLGWVTKLIQDHLAKQTPFYISEHRVRCKDGTYKWILDRGQALWDETGNPLRMVGSHTDITERKLVEDKLRKSEANLIAAQRVAHVGSWDLDIFTKEITGSQEYFRIFGFEPTQPELTYIQQCQRIYPDDRIRVQQIIEQIIATGRAYEIDFRIVQPDGQLRYVEGRGEAIVNEQGQVIKLFGTVLDITERYQMEEKLRLSEKRYRQLFEGSMDGIVLANLEGQFIDCNTSFQKMLGYSLAELQQKTFQEITPVKWHSWEAQIVEQQILARGYSDTYHKEYIRKDGTVFPIEVTSYCLLNDTGQPELMWGIVRDISERKLAEETLRCSEAREREKAQALEQAYSELKHTQAQLIQAEKMSSLGQMVAGVAHEINNPTSFIYANIPPAMEYTENLLGLIELYQQHYPKPGAEITEQLEIVEPDFLAEDFPKLLLSMKEGAERISKIVMSLRNFSRVDEAERKQVDIHEGIDNTLVILGHRLKQRCEFPEIKIIKEYGEVPKVECYPGQLNQVFMNILSNAIDALQCQRKEEFRQEHRDSNLEPTIRIRTYLLEDDLPQQKSYVIDKENDTFSSRVVISISDNGSGITAEVQPKIFDPFFTTKPVGSGTGLGLSLSYQIVVERHGGQLTCHSIPDQGTEFAIILPVVQSKMLHLKNTVIL